MKKWNFENDQWRKLPWKIKHLPIFTRSYDFSSFLLRFTWLVFLRLFFRLWIRLEVKDDSTKSSKEIFQSIYKNNPRLLLISNHVSHLDTVALMATLPFSLWSHFYSVAAQDYFFKNPLFSFFSRHCLGAIPLDRDGPGRTGTTLLCVRLLQRLNSIWMLIFPEGTRSKSGSLMKFKRGVSMFAERTETPILFLHIEGGHKLWPKGRIIPRHGQLKIHIGPVHQPAKIEVVNQAYNDWVRGVNPLLSIAEESASKTF